jgi:hypothetical protein
MSVAKIEEWLARMREARDPGPVVRVTTFRNGRDIGWSFDVTDQTNVTDLAMRIEQTVHDSMFATSVFEFRAIDDGGRFVGELSYRAQDPNVQVLTAHQPMLPAQIDETVSSALNSSRSFAGLGLKALVEAHQVAKNLLAQLEKENASLRKENAELREKVTEQWELADKLHTHRIEAQAEANKAERHGRIVETLGTALMARFLGAKTPEGRTLESRLATQLLSTITGDQAAQILPLLTDEQKLALVELMSAVEEHKDEQPGPMIHQDPAARAASANGKTAS